MIYRVRFNGMVYAETTNLDAAITVSQRLATHFKVDISRVEILPGHE